MIEQISAFFTIDMIYLWLNFGVLPFWITLMFFPHTKVCAFLVTSIFPIFILSFLYSYLLYLFYFTGYDFGENFKLYLGLDKIHILFSSTPFLLLFWIHFLTINLFCGCWIVKDSQKFSISKIVTFFPLIITYFVGPIGLFIYWIIRVIYGKRISFYE